MEPSLQSRTRPMKVAISAALIELVDELGCDVVVTTGGTGPAERDVTPEATWMYVKGSYRALENK